MSKLRVYELAKQYDKKGHEMAEILRGLGFPVKGHMSVLDEADQMIAIARAYETTQQILQNEHERQQSAIRRLGQMAST